MMEVEGTWALPDNEVKDYSLRVTVTSVNGEKLDKPVEFNVAKIAAVTKDGESAIPDWKEQDKLNGVTWRLRGFERGRCDIEPDARDEYWTPFGVPEARPYYVRSFTSELRELCSPELN